MTSADGASSLEASFRTSPPARLGFVGANLPMLGLQRWRLWRRFLLEDAARLSSSAPLFRSCCLAMVVLQVVPLVLLDIKALGWLPKLVVLASCFFSSVASKVALVVELLAWSLFRPSWLSVSK